jgi:hypothetical protein
LPIDGRWTLVRLEEDGEIPVGEERVTRLGLMEDGAWRLKSLTRGRSAEPLKWLYGLKETLDTCPVILETPGRTDVRKLLDLIESMASIATSGPPWPINFFLKVQTPEGERCIGIPILFYFPLEERRQLWKDDGRPFEWYFFWDNRIVGYDHNPVGPPEGREIIGELWISPLGSGEFMVFTTQSPFALVLRVSGPYERYETTLPHLLRRHKETRWEGDEAAVLMLSGTPEGLEERRRRRQESSPLKGNIMRFWAHWRVVPGWRSVEELAAAMTGPEREISFTNLIVRYMLYRNSPPQTVQDYVRILELAQRYGAKGVFTELPRREN